MGIPYNCWEIPFSPPNAPEVAIWEVTLAWISLDLG